MTSRSWCFTINNYTEEEFEGCLKTPCRYLVVGKEKGEKEGTPHLQGYVEFASPCRMANLKKHPQFARAHIEKRKGTRSQAAVYCKKENDFKEIGDWDAGGQGARTDLKELMKLVKEERPTLEIMESCPMGYARHHRFVEKYRAEVEKAKTREFRHVNVEVYVGDAGSGKTKKAHEENPGIFTVNPSETFPFDGYDGEKAILIDDFYGDLKYHFMLRVLDGHQLRVNTKGSHRYAQWTKVIITSNKEPNSWYRTGLTPALSRRLTSVTTFSCHQERGNTMPALEDNELESIL